MGLFDWSSAGKLSKDKFAGILLEAVQRAGEKQKLHYDAGEFQLISQGEHRHVFNLHNAYGEYCAAPKANRPQVLQRFVHTWFSYLKELPDEFADARPDLLPGVRSRSYCEFAGFQLQAQGSTNLDWPHKDWPHRILAEHLAVSLIYDLPESMMQVQQDNLSAWGVTFEEALDAAVDNLREISRQRFTMPQPGVWASPYRDNYDSSRLLLIDLIRDHSIDGEPVAVIPNRDTLLFTGSDDTTGLENMLALAEAGLAQPRPITGIPVLLAGETWQPYLPSDPGHPLYQKFRLAWVKSIGMEYSEQKELLDNLHQKTGQEIFVASYSALKRNDTGEIVSYAVWSKDVDTLLPRTDLVHFFVSKGENEGSIATSADWGYVMRVAGELLEPQGLYPERYRVRRFPSEEQLRLLGGT